MAAKKLLASHLHLHIQPCVPPLFPYLFAAVSHFHRVILSSQ
jgi:hypothetical protein